MMGSGADKGSELLVGIARHARRTFTALGRMHALFAKKADEAEFVRRAFARNPFGGKVLEHLDRTAFVHGFQHIAVLIVASRSHKRANHTEVFLFEILPQFADR